MAERIINIKDFTVLLLEDSIENNILPEAISADIWIVNHKSAWHVLRFLKKIIRSSDPRIYLKPVFLQREFKSFYKFNREYNLKQLCDGYIENLDISKNIIGIQHIFDFISELKKRSGSLYENNNEHFCRIAYYCYSRQKDIKIFESHDSLTGYSYPRLEAHFSDRNEAYLKGRRILREAHKNNFLKREYVDTTHICKKCNSGFLIYRESCPSCGGHDLQVRSLIHHFRCAYVGPEDEFRKENHLSCPKCSAQLRNLAVDYDKPGKIFYCKNEKCGKEFQKPLIAVHCVNCSTEQMPYELKIEKVYQYELTSEAINEIINIKSY
ncbi:hypothetical protein D1632_05025 [Chryseobacterium nematophagum]|uniref:Thaumarchaeal output domain-containing protein n=1 Tax=Chryseobacterium nematophagum TaxID=2305228 RepID=A0A3M7LE15_9FLAO|nr:hypothetical protein [Chryseobacterium nematophagum]RMZ60304.1 hypothetical protein D1632_05025 [Chryseobacterium nematophagum]